MELRYWLVLITGIIPLLVGSVYYSKSVAGNAWMSTSGMTEEKAKQVNMLKVFGFTYLLGVLLSFLLSSLVIHQMSISQVFFGTEFEKAGSPDQALFNSVMERVNGLHRSWKHGIIHGVMVSIFLVLPVISINAMFEQRGWKYTAVHFGYWTITLALIGGILCAYM